MRVQQESLRQLSLPAMCAFMMCRVLCCSVVYLFGVSMFVFVWCCLVFGVADLWPQTLRVATISSGWRSACDASGATNN